MGLMILLGRGLVEMERDEVTEKVIGAFYEVYNVLGVGFLEKVYQNALVVLLRKNGINVKQQSPLKEMFREETVGEYFADILVEDKIIVELKACDSLLDIHKAQVINYLKATDKKLGLLLNFGKRSFEHKRLVN